MSLGSHKHRSVRNAIGKFENRVFPVHGAIIRRSSIDFGPIGSASGIVVIGGFPLISSASFRKSLHLPKRLSVEEALS